MIYKNICTKRVYQQNGQDKVKWLQAGTLRENDDGKQFIELNMFPNTSFYVFDQKKREAQPQDTKNPDEDIQL